MTRGNDEPGAATPIDDRRAEVWVVGDDLARVTCSADVARACGLRVSRRRSIDDAVVAVVDRASGPLVLIDIGDQLSSTEEHLLELLDRQALDARCGVIVACAQPALDLVAAYVAAPFATILCDPTGADRIIAVHAAMPSTAGVAEIDRTAETLRLLQLTDEVARIARSLADLSDDVGATGAVSDGLLGYRGPPTPASIPVTASDIRTMIRWRRRRDALLNDGLFADPVWDMMLDLAAAQIEDAEVSVSSLCIAAAVPATTALRWIKALTEAGLFVRVPDARDRRRVYIRLADSVATTVIDFLGAAKGAGAGLI